MNRKISKDYQRRLSHKLKERNDFNPYQYIIRVAKLVQEQVLIFRDDDYSVSIKNNKLIINNTKTIEISVSQFKRESRKILRQLENSDHRFVVTNKGKREFVCISIIEYESLLATKNLLENHVDIELSSGL